MPLRNGRRLLTGLCVVLVLLLLTILGLSFALPSAQERSVEALRQLIKSLHKESETEAGSTWSVEDSPGTGSPMKSEVKPTPAPKR